MLVSPVPPMFISFVSQTECLIPLTRKNMSKPKNYVLYSKIDLGFLSLSYYINRAHSRKFYLPRANDASVF